MLLLKNVKLPDNNFVSFSKVGAYGALPPAFFRFHLTRDTLALGYTLLTTRACCGLSPIRLRPYWAHQIKHKKNFSCAFKNNDFFQTSTYNSQIHHRANGSKVKRLQLSQMVKYHFYKKDR